MSVIAKILLVLGASCLTASIPLDSVEMTTTIAPTVNQPTTPDLSGLPSELLTLIGDSQLTKQTSATGVNGGIQISEFVQDGPQRTKRHTTIVQAYNQSDSPFFALLWVDNPRLVKTPVTAPPPLDEQDETPVLLGNLRDGIPDGLDGFIPDFHLYNVVPVEVDNGTDFEKIYRQGFNASHIINETLPTPPPLFSGDFRTNMENQDDKGQMLGNLKEGVPDALKNVISEERRVRLTAPPMGILIGNLNGPLPDNMRALIPDHVWAMLQSRMNANNAATTTEAPKTTTSAPTSAPVNPVAPIPELTTPQDIPQFVKPSDDAAQFDSVPKALWNNPNTRNVTTAPPMAQ